MITCARSSILRGVIRLPHMRLFVARAFTTQTTKEIAQGAASSSSSFQPIFPPFHSSRYSFLHGDATDTHTYRRLFPNYEPSISSSTHTTATSTASPSLESTPPVQLLLTDPPYCLLTPRSSSPSSSSRSPSPRKKLLWDASGVGSIRFDSTHEYKQFTLSWLKPIRPYLTSTATLVIWTNFLGKRPIMEAVKQILPKYSLLSEFLWLKPTKLDESTKARKKNNQITHEILTTPSLGPSKSVGDTTSDLSLTRLPNGQYVLPPLPLSLTSSEDSYRCYEVALIFGPSNDPSLSHRGPGPMLQSIVCPYEDAISHSSGHPNAKPSRVNLPLIDAYSREDELILDPFAGSASHALTGLRMRRRVATVEYSEVWARRMREKLIKFN